MPAVALELEIIGATNGNMLRFYVRAVNADGTLDYDYRGTINFSSSDENAILPENFTFTFNEFGQKIFTVSFADPTDVTLTITDGDLTTGFSGTVPTQDASHVLDFIDDSSGDDVIDGLGGNDFITVSQGGNDLVDGNEGDDVLVLDARVRGGGIALFAPLAGAEGLSGNASWNNSSVDFQRIESFVIFSSAEDATDMVTTGAGDDYFHHVAIAAPDYAHDVIDLGAGLDLLGADFTAASAGVTMVFSGDDEPNLLNVGGQAKVLFRGVEAFEIKGSAFADVLVGLAENDIFEGGAGNDELTGGAGHDRLDGGAGDDLLTGGAGNDYYVVDSAGDVIVELAGEGVDEIETYVAETSIAGLGHVENITGFDDDIDYVLTGNALANVLTTSGGDDWLDGGAGADEMRGGFGDDTYVVDDEGDIIDESYDGEGGTDTVRTTLSNYILGADLERLVYTGGSAARLEGNGLANQVTGGDAGDLILLHHGGSDTAFGGGGNDGFYFGAALDETDIVDGGAGGNDQVALQGNYYGAFLDGANFTGVETFALLPGDETGFGDTSGEYYDYVLTLTGAWSGTTIFNGNALRGGEDMVIDVSGTTSGDFIFFGGAGVEGLTGGEGNDGFYFSPGTWSELDVVSGGGGTDNQLALRGDFSGAAGVSFGTGQLTNIQTVAVLSSQDGRYGHAGDPLYSYNLSFQNGATPGVEQLTVNAAGLLAGETLIVNAAAAFDQSFRFIGGAGADQLIASLGDDIFFGGLGADQMIGNGGSDTFLYTDVAQSTRTQTDVLGLFSNLDVIDLSAIDADTGTEGNQDFFYTVGASAFTGQAGELIVVNTFSNNYEVRGDVNGDGNADLVILLSNTVSGFDATNIDFAGVDIFNP